MEEIKLIIEAVASMPEMAIWALVVFYGYKVLIAGSLYGVVRYTVAKIHDYLTTKLNQKSEYVLKLGDSCIKFVNEQTARDAQDLYRLLLLAIKKDNSFRYIHSSDLEEIEKLIKSIK